MRKIMFLVLVLTFLALTGCSTTQSAAGGGKLTFAWLPNESGADQGEAREEIGKLVEQATGRQVVHKTTTDYAIAIEAVANGSADLAFLGPQGYIEAHNKNKQVLPLVVNSGPTGTLDDAVYYSWLAVKKGNEGPYRSGDGFAIDNIAGQKFSFVSNSSTSGFKVPSAGIVSYFSKKEQFKNLTAEDLMEGGSSKFFNTVLFGGSHQGSAINLISGKVDVAAFCNVCVDNYVQLVSGAANRPGAVYRVKADAKEPFNTVVGQEFTLISVSPVLNSPIVVNAKTVQEAHVKKLVDLLTSDEVTNNPKIFIPKDSAFSGFFGKKTKNERFLKVDDAWFNPIRELSK